MRGVLKCCTCCLFISVWGVLMLNILGIFFYVKSLGLMGDLPMPKEFTTVADFKAVVDEQFEMVAIRCFVTAFIYLLFVFLAIYLIRRERKRARRLYKRNTPAKITM
ncbi:hypothetical protein KR009_007499 [Drosophila setifemur]|nr:hypothetical protein KR009_007499 [Drosophila setifemur]